MLFASIIGFAALFVFNFSKAQEKRKLNQQTLKDLSTAMHGEAFAYAKYMAYADHARKSGNNKVVELFESTAKTEHMEHFAEEAELAGLVGTDAENLKDSIKGESYETETMYREFAQQAKARGDVEAAKRFEEIRQDEARHRDAFSAALAELKK
ncbi:MAG TPA: rubrerythrin family protein [Edaphobacter sp.]|nr:rubrerythrin family protein [Edaphobacter sp.]